MELATAHLKVLSDLELESAHDAARVWEKEEWRVGNWALAYYWRAVASGILTEITSRFSEEISRAEPQLHLFDSPGVSPEVRR